MIAVCRLQVLIDHATKCEAGNLLEITQDFTVVVEGGHYNAVWLETQPMAGGMYAVRNLRLGLNNQLIFIRAQRSDGRFPGMVTPTPASHGASVHPTWSYPGNANHSMIQGFYMASPAVDVAWLMAAGSNTTATTSGPVRSYLLELQAALVKWEGYLWQARNSSHGVLWLQDIADTGEDGSDKYRPIEGNMVKPPFESMDMMGYAFDAQKALARIAAMLAPGARPATDYEHWRGRMATTAASLKVTFSLSVA